jgi:hypothetical protein
LERKLELVRKHREEYGLNRCLAALGVSKSTWHRHQRPKVSREDKELKAKVLKVVEEHPAYGRRSTVTATCQGVPARKYAVFFPSDVGHGRVYVVHGLR